MMNKDSDSESSREEKAQARAELQANIERERLASERNMSLMREMMQAKGGGSGEEFTRGVEFMRGFAMQQVETLRQAAGKGEDTDWGGILETLGQLVQGAGLFKGLANGVPAAESVAQAAEVVS